MILATMLAIAMGMQAAAETAIAIPDPEPETWSVEYPDLIRPFVEDYHRCLNYGNRRLNGEANFEQQHSADLPRCSKVADSGIAKASDLLERNDRGGDASPDRVAGIFATVGAIHIARGRDLDRQFLRRVAAHERRQNEIAKETVPDASNQ